MMVQYFPGANTPLGFYSRFDAMLQDPRIHRRIYIKGGAGCGKSTLMRRLAQLAQDRGADCEAGLCSSDPASLDALMIPRAALAVCDATAPHVCEPPLCGVDGQYLDLSRFYAVPASQTAQLKALQQANKACYPPATHALQAVQALYRQRRALVDTPATRQRMEEAAALAAAPWLEPGPAARERVLFFNAVTPAGCISHWDLLQPAKTIYLLHDSYHMAGIYLQQIRTLALAAGQTVIVGCSPLFPAGQPSQLYLPGPGIAFLRRSSHFGPLPAGTPLELDTLLPDTSASRKSAAWLRDMTDQLLSEAVSHLARAKARHDELEAALHPYVDFDGVEAVTQALASQVHQWLSE